MARCHAWTGALRCGGHSPTVLLWKKDLSLCSSTKWLPANLVPSCTVLYYRFLASCVTLGVKSDAAPLPCPAARGGCGSGGGGRTRQRRVVVTPGRSHLAPAASGPKTVAPQRKEKVNWSSADSKQALSCLRSTRCKPFP